MKFLSATVVVFLMALSTSCMEKSYRSEIKGEKKGDETATLSTLKDFLENEKFTFNRKTQRPEPQTPSTDLYRFVLINYLDSSTVRALLADNFIKYDYACVKRGLAAVKFKDKNFMSLFVDMEFTKDKKKQRSPSLSYIRKHIVKTKSRSWLSISSGDIDDLKRNKRIHINNLYKETK